MPFVMPSKAELNAAADSLAAETEWGQEWAAIAAIARQDRTEEQARRFRYLTVRKSRNRKEYREAMYLQSVESAKIAYELAEAKPAAESPGAATDGMGVVSTEAEAEAGAVAASGRTTEELIAAMAETGITGPPNKLAEAVIHGLESGMRRPVVTENGLIGDLRGWYPPAHEERWASRWAGQMAEAAFSSNPDAILSEIAVDGKIETTAGASRVTAAQLRGFAPPPPAEASGPAPVFRPLPPPPIETVTNVLHKQSLERLARDPKGMPEYAQAATDFRLLILDNGGLPVQAGGRIVAVFPRDVGEGTPAHAWMIMKAESRTISNLVTNGVALTEAVDVAATEAAKWAQEVAANPEAQLFAHLQASEKAVVAGIVKPTIAEETDGLARLRETDGLATYGPEASADGLPSLGEIPLSNGGRLPAHRARRKGARGRARRRRGGRRGQE